MPTTRQIFLFLILVLPAGQALAEAQGDTPEPMAVEAVLELGPLPVPASHWADSAKSETLDRVLIEPLGEGRLPRSGDSVQVFGQALQWQQRSPVDTGEEPGVRLWAFRLEADRFVEGRLTVRGLEAPRLFLGGSAVSAEQSDDESGFELALQNGSHTLLLAHRGRQDADEAPQLAWLGQGEVDRLEAHLRPERRVSPQRLTNAETVSKLALSPDGRYLALAFDRRSDSADLDVARMVIRDLEADRVVREWTGGHPGSLAWSPDGRQLAVHEGNNLWLIDWPDGSARLLLANHERMSGFQWHPDGGSMVFSWTDPAEDDNGKARRMRALEDRWDTFRDNAQLYQVDVQSGLVRPLSQAEHSVSLHDIHPDGDRLLVSHRVIDYEAPPHSLTRLFEIALSDLEETEVGRFRTFNGARFAGNDYWLLAGPGLAQGDGATTGEDLTPNEYDTQLYRLAPDGEKAHSVSRDVDAALGAFERLENGDLLVSAIEGEQVVLKYFAADTNRFEAIDTGVEVMESFAASRGDPVLIALSGTDADRPQRVHLVGRGADSPRLIHDSQPEEYADVVLGEVEPWRFTNADGDEIDGRYYLPPDFDPESSYPLIVYYYGGTTPVNRQFTGRYPFNLWAAQGYVIYVVQPRGAIGYGQEFSARHVNAWGRYTAEDIIEGTEKFVAAHEFVDAERIGNIGASYGGFMTMHLATLTDRFSASISHAGISALTSYWGQGWWGFGYSGIASRGSFPWNDPELYVGQSPVYSADEITTPLLLLTGDSDTNVPPGESHQMYTALKLLGREVELVEFPGEDHWIIDREQRYLWWDSMLAWFDLHLKDQPEWWHHLYPETRD